MNDCKLKKEAVKRSEYPWKQTESKFEHMIAEPENYNLIFEILTCNEGTDTQADIKRGGICSTCVNAKLHKSYPKYIVKHPKVRWIVKKYLFFLLFPKTWWGEQPKCTQVQPRLENTTSQWKLCKS